MTGLGRRRARLVGIIGALAAAGFSLTFVVGVAADAAQRAKSSDSAEAWYAASPVDTCALPLGCPPTTVPTSPYPADTLHVGVAAGQETARTYLVPDLSVLPYDATVSAATLTLPVNRDNTAGTVSPESAAMLACLTTEPVKDGTEGSSEKPPAYDAKVCAKPTYDKKGAGTFTLSLTKFLRLWATGHPMFGVVLVPDLRDATPTTVWHVTTNGRQRRNAPHVQTVLAFTTPPPVTGPGPQPTPPRTPSAAPVPAAVPQPVAVPPAVSSDNLPPAPQPAQEPQIAPAAPPQAAVITARSFQYPAAFLLPLGFLIAGLFLVRTFTRDPLAGRVNT